MEGVLEMMVTALWSDMCCKTCLVHKLRGSVKDMQKSKQGYSPNKDYTLRERERDTLKKHENTLIE